MFKGKCCITSNRHFYTHVWFIENSKLKSRSLRSHVGADFSHMWPLFVFLCEQEDVSHHQQVPTTHLRSLSPKRKKKKERKMSYTASLTCSYRYPFLLFECLMCHIFNYSKAETQDLIQVQEKHFLPNIENKWTVNNCMYLGQFWGFSGN